MKVFLIVLFIFFIFSCSEKKEVESNCPSEIEQKGYCDLFNEAKWCFYSSNSHGKFEYIDTSTHKRVSLTDVLPVDLQVTKYREFNDTIEFTFFPTNEHDLYSINQTQIFINFGFNKVTRNLIYRDRGVYLNTSYKMNGYIFNSNDDTFKFIDSIYKNNRTLANDMRVYGLYPINEQDSILIAKLKSNRKDINPCLINYAKQKGYIQ